MRKSQWKGPDVKKYQVLYRSVRDPLANDADAPTRVLSEIGTKSSSSAGKQRQTELTDGEAAEHGVFYDDSDYDYMQHLRPIGSSARSEAVFLEAPSTTKARNAASAKEEMIKLPPETLPAAPDQERSYADYMGIPDNPYTFGLQPDMDPRLREVLEALEDEAYVEEDAGEDFFDDLVQTGEKRTTATDEEEDEWTSDEDEVPQLTEYEREMSKFKRTAATRSDDSDFEDDEDLDTVGEMPSLQKSKRKNKGSTAASSAFSMSSSSMFRNQGLRDLDDQFDQIEKEYEDDSDEDSEEDDEDDEPVDIADKRHDLSGILDDFLSRYEVLGGKLKQRSDANGPDAPASELEAMREMLRDERSKAKILERAAQLDALEEQGKREKTDRVLLRATPASQADRWDCETVLSTYSNLENHPRLMRLRDVTTSNKKKNAVPVKQIILDPRTGLPSTAEELAAEEDSSSDTETESQAPRETISRPRDESKEEKKARKAAVKAERQSRRTEKKANKEMFGTEKKRQVAVKGRRTAADVSVQNHPSHTVVTSLS